MAPFLYLCLCFAILITTTLCMFDIKAAATQTRGATTSFSRRQLDALLPSIGNDLSKLTEPIHSDIDPVLSDLGSALSGGATAVQSLLGPIRTDVRSLVDGIATPIANVVSPVVTDIGNGLGGLETLVHSLVDPIIAPSSVSVNQADAPPGSTAKETTISPRSTWSGSSTASAGSSFLPSVGSTTGINSATTLEPGPLTASSTSAVIATSIAVSDSQSQLGDSRTSISQPLTALSATSQILSTARTADMSSSAMISVSSEVPKVQATSNPEFSSGPTATRSELQSSLITAASAPTAALTILTASVHVSDLVTSLSGHFTTIPIFSEAVSTKTLPPYTVVTTSGTTYTVSMEPSTASISASESASPSTMGSAGTGIVSGGDQGTGIANSGGRGTSSASSTSTPGAYDGMITLPNGVKVPLAAVVAPVVIGFALASALAVFCFWRRRKLRKAIDDDGDDEDQESLHPTSNTSSGFFSSQWSLSTFRDIEAAGQRHSNSHESHNDHGREDEEQSCLAPVERFVRHIFELDASEPPPQELEAVEQAQELEAAERPQELEVEDNDDLRGCAALIQRLLRQMRGQPTRQVRETLDMNLVEEIDFIEELRAHNELRQTHRHEKSADLKSPAKAYLRQEHTPTEEELDPPPRYER